MPQEKVQLDFNAGVKALYDCIIQSNAAPEIRKAASDFLDALCGWVPSAQKELDELRGNAKPDNVIDMVPQETATS